MDRRVPSKLLEDLSKAADIVRGHNFIHIFSHYDADGLSAAAIIAKTLIRQNKEFCITLLTSLDDVTFQRIKNSNADCIIITDLGASYIKELDELTSDIIVLDHHTLDADAKRISYMNPHLYGIEGMSFGCGSTMACLFAIEMDEKNWDLVQIAFAGIYGDKQIIDGLNGYLLDEGVERGYITTEKGSIVPYGKLTEELFLTTEPYIRGVSGSAEGVAALLTEAMIPRDAVSSGLSDIDIRKLSSSIILKLIEQGVSADTIDSVSGIQYSLKDWNFDSAGLASILDGCGRNGLMGLGVAAACGDTKSIKIAEETEKEYRRDVILNTVELDGRELTQMTNIQWFDSTRSGYTGVLCGIAMSYFSDQTKPTFGINASEEIAKISGRATNKLLSRGVDLSSGLREACAAVGGAGGGHRIASGGSFPSDMKEEFMKKLDEIIGSQINAR
jgi:RecJ-like exonuclease